MVEDRHHANERRLVALLADRAGLRLVDLGGADIVLPFAVDTDAMLIEDRNVEHPVLVELAVQERDLAFLPVAEEKSPQLALLRLALFGLLVFMRQRRLGGLTGLSPTELLGRFRLGGFLPGLVVVLLRRSGSLLLREI